MNKELPNQAIRDHIVKEILGIISMEEAYVADWDAIEKRSLKAIDMIIACKAFDGIDPYFYKFLEDWDVRKKDSRYQKGQHKAVLAIIQE